MRPEAVSHGRPTGRAAIGRLAKSAGGKLEAFYLAFGNVDAYVIVDVPDPLSAAAAAAAVDQSGGATVK